MDVPVIAGRAFDRAHGDDKAPLYEDHFDPKTPVNVVIDRSFSDQLGFESPDSAVDQIVYMGLSQHGLPDQPMRIIGVVDDKPLDFAGLGASASLFRLGSGMPQVVVRISGKNVSGALEAIRGEWAKLAPARFPLFVRGPALCPRLRAVRPGAQAFIGLAVFAFVISTIGLFGMATHVANRRRHEIGVRKTLGASTGRSWSCC